MATLLAARELARMVVLALAQPDRLQPFASPAPALPHRHARVEERQLDVLQRAGAGQQVELLEDEADLGVAGARQLVAAQAGHVAPVQQVAAGG
jgi:hypothetical protein